MKLEVVADFEQKLAEGRPYAVVTRDRYLGSVGTLVRIINSNYQPPHLYWEEGQVSVNRTTTSWGTTDTDFENYGNGVKVFIRFIQDNGRPKTIRLSRYDVDIQFGDFTPAFIDTMNGPAVIKDKLGRQLEVGNLVAFVQEKIMRIGTVEKINHLGDATMKLLEGGKTVAKILDNNCVVIDKCLDDAIVLHKLTT